MLLLPTNKRETSENKEQTPQTLSWFGLLSFVVRNHQRKFIWALVLSLGANAFMAVANPLVLKYLFDEGVIRGDFKLFVMMAVGSILMFTLWRIWVYFNRIYTQKLKVEIMKETSQKMVKKYFEIPYNEVLKKDKGYFVSRVYDELISLVAPTIESYFSLFVNIVTLVISLVIVISMSWRASLTILLALPLVYFVTRTYSGKIKQLSKVEKEKEADLKGILTRAINSFKFTNVFALQKTVMSKVKNSFESYARAYLERYQSGAKYETFNGTMMSYAETFAIIGAGYEMLVGRMSFGGYMAFMAAYWMVLGSVRSFFGLVPEISRLTGIAERVKEFENTSSERANITYANKVFLKNISFGYDQKTILENLFWEAKSNEKVLVLGTNGSGKSTFANILSGLLEPSSGSLITLPLSRISAVVYPLEFIPGSIRDNVSFIKSESEKQRFESLLEKFSLEEYVDKDPSELSAGQKKKFEILMGLVKEADVYIFDEPLAGVDVSAKNEVMEAIFKHTENKTLIVIMHGDEQFHTRFDRTVDLNVKEYFEFQVQSSKFQVESS